MKTRALHALLVLAATTLPLHAQAGAGESAGRDTRTLRHELDDWRERNGSSWHATPDRRTGRATFLFGGSVAPPYAPADEADFFALARGAIEESEPLHGIESATLLEERVLPIPMSHVGSSDKVAVRFAQVLHGVPVELGSVNVLFDLDGNLLSVQSSALPALIGLATTPLVDDARAVRLAAATFESDTGLVANRVIPPELVIMAADSEDGSAALTWRVGLQWLTGGSDPVGHDYYVDAASGRIVKRAANIHFLDVTGTVTTFHSPGSRPDIPSNPEAETPAAHLTLTSDQGSATTDADGDFTFVGVSTVTNVVASYEGPFVTVDNQAGADYSLSAGTLAGSGNGIVMNAGTAQLDTAQANCHVGVNLFRDWVRALNPGDATMDFQAVANPNIPASCSAYFDGVSTNYYQEGGGCTNTGFSAVISHEMGHWANVLYGTGNGGDGMGEGNADIFALYQYDTPILGEDFCGPGCFRRTGENTRPYCGDGNGGCYGEVHDDGEPWMGAAWKVRRNLKTSLGTALGGLTADTLFMAWMLGYDQTTIDSVIEVQWLTLDDDNGNIDDGTPNYADIDAGFREQQFPGFDLALISVSDVTALPHTTAPGPYTVDATIQALVAPPVTAASLFFSTDGGPFAELPMGNVGGDVHRASIPAPGGSATIRYYVTGTDSAANTDAFPEGAPAETLTFLVGELQPVFTDSFSSDLGWTVTGTTSTGDWERTDPEGTSAQPEDDHPAGGGTQCYVTDGTAGASVGAFDVDGGPTILTSPPFDLAADGTVSYAYWAYNDDGDDELVVEISDDGGASWNPVASYRGGGGGWVEASFIVSDHATPTTGMRLRFSVADEPNDSITESAVDDVEVRVLTAPPCPGPVNYCTAVPNSTGSAAAIGWSGSASVASNDLVLLCTNGPAGNNGLFVYSPDQVEVPLGNGNLCVGNTTLGFVLRLTPGALDGSGEAAFAFDNTDPSDPAGQVFAGETWYFQYWFRDPAAGGAFFNFSDGLCVTFCP